MANNKQIESLGKLFSLREQIENNLAEIESILHVHFSEETAVAKQHWIAQIKTALKDNLVYLPRGEYSMDYTLNRIQDKIIDHNDKGVSKYV